MHSYFANKTQPYPTADYPIFAAEVASTLNEALLIHKELEIIKDDDARLSLLMNYLDGIKGTVFRQTQFARMSAEDAQFLESYLLAGFSIKALAEQSGLDPVFTEKFLRFIVAEVIHHHQRIAEGEQL